MEIVKLREEVAPAVSPQEVRRVVLLASASRGGSSLLYEVLSADEDFASLAGEHVPFYRLHAVDAPLLPSRSDQLGEDDGHDAHETAELLARTILTEVRMGRGTTAPGAPETTALLASRLALQWPELDLTLDQLHGHVRAASRLDEGDDPHVLLRTARRLQELGHPVDPAYYDCSLGQIGVRSPGGVPSGPPRTGFLVEEPPFVCPEPGRLPRPGELERAPLLLKAPLDVYRLPLLRRMFPAAEFTVVHLVRNPASSINGLKDGWLSHGFFSQDTLNFGQELAIPGYTRPDRPWTRHWWNFDLPPGWQDYVDRPLLEVCAFQWTSAHAAILDALSVEQSALPMTSTVRVSFEELLEPRSRRLAIDRIRNAAGLGTGTVIRPEDTLPVVMATRPPHPGRWRQDAESILPLLTRGETGEIARRIGYDMSVCGWA